MGDRLRGRVIVFCLASVVLLLVVFVHLVAESDTHGGWWRSGGMNKVGVFVSAKDCGLLSVDR